MVARFKRKILKIDQTDSKSQKYPSYQFMLQITRYNVNKIKAKIAQNSHNQLIVSALQLHLNKQLPIIEENIREFILHNTDLFLSEHFWLPDLLFGNLIHSTEALHSNCKFISALRKKYWRLSKYWVGFLCVWPESFNTAAKDSDISQAQLFLW